MDVYFFSVYDSAAARYLDPFTGPTPEVAIRGFKQACNKPGHAFNDHPADYTLFVIGQFDPEKGLLLPIKEPVNLGNALTHLEHGAQIPMGLHTEPQESVDA